MDLGLIRRDDAAGFDIEIRGGDLVRLVGIEEIAQRVKYRLMTWLSECAYDRDVGMPYLDLIFGFEPVPGIVALITSEVQDVDGVDEIEGEPEFLLDQATRVLTISLTIRAGSDTAGVTLELTP